MSNLIVYVFECLRQRLPKKVMTIPTPPNPPPTYLKQDGKGFHCSICKKVITISRTLHNFRYHRLCCVRGEGTNRNESDFDNDSEFEGCGGEEFNSHEAACLCVYDNTKVARWPKRSWQSGAQVNEENTVLQRHNADKKK